MSSTTASNWSLDTFSTPSSSCWVAVSGDSLSSSLMPTTPCSGVRISWLITARKPALAFTAASASSREAASSAVRRLTRASSIWAASRSASFFCSISAL
ncbi:hypothetical protein Y695_04346 [Hydrogenophaga sp. T4]|nr:hypothetical protein Y695_04346 [Hydrogenophaga sp. T4]